MLFFTLKKKKNYERKSNFRKFDLRKKSGELGSLTESFYRVGFTNAVHIMDSVYVHTIMFDNNSFNFTQFLPKRNF